MKSWSLKSVVEINVELKLKLKILYYRLTWMIVLIETCIDDPRVIGYVIP